ncbi:hypothetical protein PspLS_04710 [Pyricularia sp. CBS 133598]|nr:hypothetical protein PspLS_04710 [Pyricularia sp. CBS 133598]
MGPDHDGSDQPVVILCWARSSRLLWFRHLLTPHAARASSSGDPDRALFLVHNDAERLMRGGGVNESVMAWAVRYGGNISVVRACSPKSERETTEPWGLLLLCDSVSNEKWAYVVI